MKNNVIMPLKPEKKPVYVKCRKCSYTGNGLLEPLTMFFTTTYVLNPEKCPECGGKLYIDAKRIPPIIVH